MGPQGLDFSDISLNNLSLYARSQQWLVMLGHLNIQTTIEMSY